MENFFTADVIWLSVGCVALLLEVTAVPAIGCFFVGLGALSLGGLMTFGVIYPESTITQIAFFLCLTVMWAVVLWRPFQNFIKKGGDTEGYNDMIGSSATVEKGGLKGKKSGKVRWSGALMNARIAKDASADAFKEGEQVVVKYVEGTTLFVDGQ